MKTESRAIIKGKRGSTIRKIVRMIVAKVEVGAIADYVVTIATIDIADGHHTVTVIKMVTTTIDIATATISVTVIHSTALMV